MLCENGKEGKGVRKRRNTSSSSSSCIHRLLMKHSDNGETPSWEGRRSNEVASSVPHRVTHKGDARNKLAFFRDKNLGWRFGVRGCAHLRPPCGCLLEMESSEVRAIVEEETRRRIWKDTSKMEVEGRRWGRRRAD